MGSSVGAKSKKEEEKNATSENQEKSNKSQIPKDISKEKESKKDNQASQSKTNDIKNTKSEKFTNPIININNLQPGNDSSLSKKLINENEKTSNYISKISNRNSQYLLSEIRADVNLEKEKSGKDIPLKDEKEKNKDKKKDKKSPDKNKKEEQEEQENELLPNEKLILKDETRLFIKTMTENQVTNLENYNKYYREKGQHIFIALGETFSILNDFYTTLSVEHKMYDQKPLYNYRSVFDENYDNYTIRGIAYNVPINLSELYRQSDINTLFQKNNISFNSSKKTQTNLDVDYMSTATLKQILDMNENSKDFIKAFNNISDLEKLNDLIRTESEKCDQLHSFHFIGDIFDGSSMGILCNVLNNMQERYKKVLKLVHLNYYDSYEHRAFNKIKNYIYTISNLYDKCNLVNFFNTVKSDQILSSLTVGERIPDYEKSYSINQILADLLVNPKINYIYSNGVEIKEKDCDEKYAEILYQDCKEDKGHLYYKAQMSSLTIYKGNKIFKDEGKIKLSEEMSKIVDKYIQNNRAYYNFYDIKKNFDVNDFIANFHQSRYFVRYTEEFFMDFIQNYNFKNFSNEEKQLKNETINNVYGILNEFKELWRYKI